MSLFDVNYYANNNNQYLVWSAVGSVAGLVGSGITYANAHLAGVARPKGMVLGSIGLTFSMPIMSLVTQSAFRSNVFAGVVAGAVQLGVGLWSLKKASEWAEQPVTYTEIAMTALVGATELAVGVAIVYNK